MTDPPSRGRRSRLLVFWALAVLAALLLSLSLTDVALEPGRRFGFPTPAGTGGAEAAPAAWNGLLPILRIVTLCLAALSGISLIVHLASREGRRRLLRDLILFLIVVLAATLLFRIRAPDTPREKEASGETGQSDGPPVSLPPDAVPPFDGNAPSWAGWAATAGLSLAAAAAAAGILAVVFRQRRKRGGMAGELAATADAALVSLRAGAEPRNVVIRCYAEMSGIVAKGRGIHRGADMTPSEFVEVLAGVGLPEPPVRSLTGVFEAVRYGNAAPTEEIGRQALEALARIAAACREAPG